MKHITKLFLLAILVVFASCQNETLTEGASSIAEEELALENEILVSDGEEDETFVLNNDLESEMPAQELSFSLSSNSTAEGGPSCTPDIEGLVLSLPATIEGETTAKPGASAYFDLTLTGDSVLAGVDIPAWCVDIAGDLGVESNLVFDVYSSYADNIPTNRVDNPENFDKVNWLINQTYIGEASPSGGVYTFGDVQWAIWEIIDDTNCRSCAFLGDDWSTTKGQELVDAAIANGEGFTPACGEQMAIVLVPNDNKQSVIISKEVEPVVVPCSDCDGKVTKLELEFDWGCAKKIDILQRNENTCYGKWIYSNSCAKPGEIINIAGKNHDGTFGKYIYIYINNCYYTKIKTDCDVKIGPGYTKGVFNVISGESSNGGELCEYVKPDYKCYRHWCCQYYSSCKYGY